MTTTLRVACRRCRDVEVPIARGRLVVGMTAAETGTALQFDCPRCARVGLTRLGDRAATLLMSAGIAMVSSPVPEHPVGEAPRAS